MAFRFKQTFTEIMIMYYVQLSQSGSSCNPIKYNCVFIYVDLLFTYNAIVFKYVSKVFTSSLHEYYIFSCDRSDCAFHKRASHH